MTAAFVMGTLLAAALGPMTTMWQSFYGVGCLTATGAFSRLMIFAALALLWREFSRKCLMTVNIGMFMAGFFMALPYAPPPVSSGKHLMSVVYSDSCGDDVSDLILWDHINFYALRGRAAFGDDVKAAVSVVGKKGLSRITSKTGVVNHRFLCQARAYLRSLALARVSRFPDDVRIWLMAFVFGDDSELSEGTYESFKSLGLMHVLVLSGGHLSLVFFVSQFLIRLPAHMLYLFKRISPFSWVVIWSSSRAIALMPLACFCLVAGFGQSLQRAFIAVCVVCLADNFGRPALRQTKLKLIFAIQAVIFPANILSPGMLLSWCGVLILMTFHSSTFRRSYWMILSQVILVQLIFCLSTLIFFGEVSVSSLHMNLLMLPIMGALLPLDLLAVMIEIPGLDELIIRVNRLVFEFIAGVSLWQKSLPMSDVSLPRWARESAVIHNLSIMAALSMLYFGVGARDPLNRKARGFWTGALTRQGSHG